MEELPQPQFATQVEVQPDPEAEHFYEGAFSRIMRGMFVLAAAFTIAAEFRFGWHVAGGFLVGCGMAILNFLWIKRTVNALAQRIVEPEKVGDPPPRATFKFMVRWAFLAAIAYVIFKSSILSLTGVLVGLFLPVAAILVEAVYETYAALRRGL